MGEALMPRRGGGFTAVMSLDDIAPVATGMSIRYGVNWQIPELLSLQDGAYLVRYEQCVLQPGMSNYRSRGVFILEKSGATFFVHSGNYADYRTFDVGYSGADEFSVKNQNPVESIAVVDGHARICIHRGYDTGLFTSDLCSMQEFTVAKIDNFELNYLTKDSFIK